MSAEMEFHKVDPRKLSATKEILSVLEMNLCPTANDFLSPIS
jgi:hypothetical protein